jgi:hypothetical protein
MSESNGGPPNRQILLLYGALERLQPSHVVSLNRAVAVAMVQGPEAALALVDELARRAHWRITTCCIPRAPTYCAAWDTGKRPAKLIPGRSRWRPTRASGAFWSGVWPRCGHAGVRSAHPTT